MLELEHHGDVALLRLANGKVNALSRDLFAESIQVLDQVAKSDARALVLTGHGQVFSAGLDLKQLMSSDEDGVRAHLKLLHDACVALFSFPKPAVAAINGHAIAGGAVLAFACDHRVIGRSGLLGVTELRVGVPFPVAPLEIVRFAVGTKGLQELMYFAEVYPPDEALRRGLVDEIADDPVAVAMERAQRLAAVQPDAFAHTKRQLREQALMRITNDSARLDAIAQQIWMRDDIREALKSYFALATGKA